MSDDEEKNLGFPACEVKRQISRKNPYFFSYKNPSFSFYAPAWSRENHAERAAVKFANFIAVKFLGCNLMQEKNHANM